jgi:hypothetical protein
MTAFRVTTLAAGIAFAASMLTSAHAEPSVFKCRDKAGGVVFSPQPCGKDAKAVDTSRALLSGTSPNIQGVSDRAAMSRIDGDCSNRERAINDQTDNEVSAANTEIENLSRAGAQSASGYGSAASDKDLRARILAAKYRKGVAVQAQPRKLADLRRDCDTRREEERKAEQERDDKAREEAQNPAAAATASGH